MKPILFNTQMVQAILRGEKTQTRRVVSDKLRSAIESEDGKPWIACDDGDWYPGHEFSRIQPGDVLWVRETWTCMRDITAGHKDYFFAANELDHDTVSTTYLVDDDGFDTGKPFPWKPSIHMPREIARIFLRVIGVRCERVQDINETDALAEGMPECNGHRSGDDCACAIIEYQKLWDEINRKRNGGIYAWEHNPWVWVYDFKRITREEAEAA